MILEASQRRSTIQQLWSEITEPLTAHNEITLATALPPELLSNIFGYLCGRAGVGADLIRATRVCKRWRAVALEDPLLWTIFPAHNVSCVTACLARSKDGPISLTLAAIMPPTMELVLARITRRIRSLYVAIPEAEDIKTLLKRLSRPAPLLEELHIAYLADSDPRRGRDPIEVRSFPLFGSQVPSLLSLTLNGVVFPFNLPDTLSHLDYSIESEVYLEEILPVLAELRLLESLKLAARVDGYADDVTADLLNLASLVLKLDIPRPISRLLSALSLPASVNVDISANLGHDGFGMDSFGDIVHGITPSSHPGLRSLTGMRRLQLSWDAEHLLLQAHRDPDDYAKTPAWSISARWAANSWTGLVDCRRTFDTSLIEVLIVTWKPASRVQPQHSEGWAALLRSMPTLKTLRLIHLGQKDPRFLLSVMWGLTADGDLVCPSLEIIEMLDVDMSRLVLNLHMLTDVRGSGQGGGALKRVELFNCKLDTSGEWKELVESCSVEVSVDEV